ncbi:MAG: hypothetical protein QOJ13_1185 [Gaiellales bacterium]|jgi:hypothetical protein|nr:hypothetical protein [Gaiellales bacterium]
MDEQRDPPPREDEPDHAQEADTVPEEQLTHAQQDDPEHPQHPEHAQEAETISERPLRHAQRKER